MFDIKRKKQLQTVAILAIRILFFLLMPSTFTTAFSGVKEIFTKLGKGDAIAMTAFVTVLVVLLIYTVVFGRFFCGFACAFGSLGDAIRWLYLSVCKKINKKPLQIKESWQEKLSYLKYIVLAAIAALCFLGNYAVTTKKSPWDVFSMITNGNFQLGAYGIGVILLLFICIGMALCDRFFCRFLCPMGAVFATLPTLPDFTVQRDTSQCRKGCSLCNHVCPANLTLPEKNEGKSNGDCFQCGKCISMCPAKNAGIGNIPIRGNEIWFTFARAVLLYAVLKWAGV
ncbi:MAG: 4Fe-4S binding protein [Lachnospiraceae bacterium]